MRPDDQDFFAALVAVGLVLGVLGLWKLAEIVWVITRSVGLQ